MTTAEIIKTLRIKNNLTQEELAAKLGIKKAAVSKYENGTVLNLKRDTIEKIAHIFNVKPSVILGIEDEPPTPTFDNIYPIEIKRYPLLGEIACGVPKLAEQDYESYVECGADVKADFVLRCKGDSMINSRIFDGDIVFIREQPTVENGEIAAVIIDDEATLKRFRKVGDMVILSPENPNYSDIIVNLNESSNIRILGKAIGFQSNIL